MWLHLVVATPNAVLAIVECSKAGASLGSMSAAGASQPHPRRAPRRAKTAAVGREGPPSAVLFRKRIRIEERPMASGHAIGAKMGQHFETLEAL